MAQPASVRFRRHYIKTKGCWYWIGAKIPKKEYGTFKLHTDCTMLAHRASYILHIGPIPKGKWVLHSCDNPSCVNPTHLFLGTHQDNMDDMVAKGRQCRLGRPRVFWETVYKKRTR